MTATLRRVALAGLAGILGLTVVAAPAAAKQPAKTGPTIVVIAAADDGEFDTLTQLVVQLGLVDALSARGQLTVFAPTDAAFADIGITPDTVDDAIAALGEGTLRDIVLFHVAHGARFSSDVVGSTRIRMLNGDFARVSVSTDPLRVTVGGAELNLGLMDIRASNGVIHVTNDVLLPPA
jgi:uncharacterized surface protein with fasciclin (FAS1) repeats